MKSLLTTLLLLFGLVQGFSQDSGIINQWLQKLIHVENNEILDRYWLEITTQHALPLVYEDSVMFLYRGDAKSVSWMGDFNGWGYDKAFHNLGKKISNTDIWFLKASFPKDARLDYKIVLDDNRWILDPLNPNYQWSGVGGGSPNSELRMPYWKEDLINIPIASLPHGQLIPDVLINSKILGYQITYNVFLPANYKQSETYPVIYVTDGYEYLHERMGNMTTILDNLINQKKIRPIIAVFIDHREPINRSNNRRMSELAMNEKYLTFFTAELIPAVEERYSITTNRSERAILGTSMGGLTAAYFSFSKPDIFGLAGIQSPAFWFKPEIYAYCDNPDSPPVKTYLTTGSVNDAQEGAQKMKNILEKNTCTYQYNEVNQGHSWGNWRDRIDDILIYFFEPK